MKTYRRLTRADRISIEKLSANGKAQTQIAENLGLHRSTISREISSRKPLHEPYRRRGAQANADANRKQIQFYERTISGALEEVVTQLLTDKFSPEQICDRLGFENAKWSLCHETIYTDVYHVNPQLKRYLRWKNGRWQKRRQRKRRSLGDYPC